MRRKIFNRGVFRRCPGPVSRKILKSSVLRSTALSVSMIIAAVTGCSDGAINAYMDYEPNRAPQILELKSDYSGPPVPGDVIIITCETHDPDGNPLTYNYTSSQGSFTDQSDTGTGSQITFIVGTIAGGEDVNITVTVTDSKDASVAATLNVGRSSMGPVITLEGPVHRTIGADGYAAVIFRSNMDGYYQVGLAGDGTAADKMDPERSLFIVKKNSDTVFTICGPTDSDIINKKYLAGVPRLSTGSENRVLIKVIDGMGQVSVHEIVFNVQGTIPDIGDPEIRVTDLTKESMTLNWNYATDRDNVTGDQQKGMQYRVYMSVSDNISTREEAELNGTVLMDWTPDLNFFTVTGLTPSTVYYFNVAVKDSDGLQAIYTPISGSAKDSTVLQPQVIYTIPAQNDIDVVINSDILIDFNREMDEETISSDTVFLRKTNGDDVPVNLSYSSGVTTVDPLDNLENGMRYYLTVSGNIEDTQGDALGSDYQFSFTAMLESGSYTVRYDGNGATGGGVPVDNTIYFEGDTAAVQGNTENLVRTGYFFSGWNTAPDGSGTDYAGGDNFTMGSADQVLYAKWKAGFVTRWKTYNPGESEYNQVTIPVFDGETYDYTVDWGDGTINTHRTGSATHTYTDPGIYPVAITGTFPRIYFNNSGDREKILSIESWGEIKWTSMARAFYGCSNLTYNATDAPDLSNVTDMSCMFFFASSLNGDISSWDVSSVTDMSYLFAHADLFNGDLNSWDVSSVTDMKSMFSGAAFFNSDLSNWDVRNVTDMSHLFWNATSFNGDVRSWNVSKVTLMDFMFAHASSFNRDLSGWNVSNVTDMACMFLDATSFNGNISSWNVSNVTNMRSMFHIAISFDVDVSNWNVSSVTNMSNMFYNANAFSNHDLSGWDVRNASRYWLFSTGWGPGNTEPNWPY